MLVNKTKEAIEITYDQKPIVVESGKSLDVRDFGVGNEFILPVEKLIILKNPGIFEQKKTEDLIETNKAHGEKIELLEKEAADLSGKIVAAEKGCKAAEDKLNKVLTENEGFKIKNKSLVAEVGELKAKIKAAL